MFCFLVRPDRFERPTLWFEAVKYPIINNLQWIGPIAVHSVLLLICMGLGGAGRFGFAIADNASMWGPRTISGTVLGTCWLPDSITAVRLLKTTEFSPT